jgi:carbamoylphosphate synthase large subunit
MLMQLNVEKIANLPWHSRKDWWQSAKSVICHTMDEVIAGAEILNYPVVVRPSFTMGGLGSGIAFDEDNLRQIAGAGLAP